MCVLGPEPPLLHPRDREVGDHHLSSSPVVWTPLLAHRGPVSILDVATIAVTEALAGSIRGT